MRWCLKPDMNALSQSSAATKLNPGMRGVGGGSSALDECVELCRDGAGLDVKCASLGCEGEYAYG
jgi:hypothetical protein